MNSLYGALLNPFCRFFDSRLGQSTTLTGRNITKHMSAKINEIITGEYDNVGKSILYGDTDSISSNSNVKTNIGTFTIEELFEKSRIKWQKDEKEYAVDDNFKVAGYSNAKPEFEKFNYIYRHKVNKKRFKIVDSLNNEVIVTEDHSIMVLDDNNNLIERKPNDLKNGDRIISLKE